MSDRDSDQHTSNGHDTHTTDGDFPESSSDASANDEGTRVDGEASHVDSEDTHVDNESDRVDNEGDDSHHDEGHDHHDEGHDHHDGHDSHHRHDLDRLQIAVVTVSSSRDLADDPSGDLIVNRIKGADHELAARKLVADDHDKIQTMVNDLVDRDDVDAVITTGGTGVTPDDVTPEAVKPLLDKPLPGFGELFRQLSYEEIGTMVVGTRAIGGVAEGVPVFSIPGSENAARLGIEEIILPEIGHLAGLARREEN